MSEQDPTLSPLEQVEIRAGESQARFKLFASKLTTTLEVIRRLPVGESRVAEETYFKVTPLAEETAKIKCDVAWFEALVQTGLAPKTILQIWDLKDEIIRNASDSKSKPKST